MKKKIIEPNINKYAQNKIKQIVQLKNTDQNFPKVQSKNQSVCKSKIRPKSLYRSSDIYLKFRNQKTTPKNIDENEKKKNSEYFTRKSNHTKNDCRLTEHNYNLITKNYIRLRQPRLSDENFNLLKKKYHKKIINESKNNLLEERNEFTCHLGKSKSITSKGSYPLMQEVHNSSNKKLIKKCLNNKKELLNETNQIKSSFKDNTKLIKNKNFGRIYCNRSIDPEKYLTNKEATNNLNIENNEFHILDKSQLVNLFPYENDKNSKFVRESLRYFYQDQLMICI